MKSGIHRILLDLRDHIFSDNEISKRTLEIGIDLFVT